MMKNNNKKTYKNGHSFTKKDWEGCKVLVNAGLSNVAISDFTNWADSTISRVRNTKSFEGYKLKVEKTKGYKNPPDNNSIIQAVEMRLAEDSGIILDKIQELSIQIRELSETLLIKSETKDWFK